MAAGRSGEGQKLVELALAVKRVKVVAAADVALADEDLRHARAALRLRQHLVAQLGLSGDLDLGEGDALLLQKVLCRHAVGAPGLGIDRHHGSAPVAAAIWKRFGGVATRFNRPGPPGRRRARRRKALACPLRRGYSLHRDAPCWAPAP